MGALSTQLDVFKAATYWSSTGKLGKGFGIAYPDDASKVQAYVAQLDAGHYDAAPPTGLTTKHAQGLVGMLAALAAVVAVKPTPPPAESPDNTIVLASAPGGSIVDAAGRRWTINNGRVAIDGVADTVTSNVVRLMYEAGKVWQENTFGFYWYKVSPTDTWLPAGGTKVSPVPGEKTLHVSITGTPQEGKTLLAAIA